MLSKNQIKNIQALHLKKYREQQKLFIAEGSKVVMETIFSSIVIRQLYATSPWIKDFRNSSLFLENPIIQQNIQRVLVEVSEEELKKISTFSTPNLVLAVCETPNHQLNIETLTSTLNLYLDGIRDPGNLGTIIRVAEWFGVKQIICSKDTTELYSPKTIQSTMGSFTRINMVEYELGELLLKAKNLQNTELAVYGADLCGENIFTIQHLTNGLLVIGNESNGISDATQLHLTKRIKIPAALSNKAESLNAAIATSILLAEFFRREG